MSPSPQDTERTGPLSGISRNTVFLGLVSFFNDLGSDMVHPHLLAVFLQSVLHLPMVGIGLIGGITQATASVLKPVSGWLSDKYRRRRPAVLFGYWIAACTRPLLALCGALPTALARGCARRRGMP